MITKIIIINHNTSNKNKNNNKNISKNNKTKTIMKIIVVKEPRHQTKQQLTVN
jgi:hypothetical protein